MHDIFVQPRSQRYRTLYHRHLTMAIAISRLPNSVSSSVSAHGVIPHRRCPACACACWHCRAGTRSHVNLGRYLLGILPGDRDLRARLDSVSFILESCKERAALMLSPQPARVNLLFLLYCSRPGAPKEGVTVACLYLIWWVAMVLQSNVSSRRRRGLHSVLVPVSCVPR